MKTRLPLSNALYVLQHTDIRIIYCIQFFNFQRELDLPPLPTYNTHSHTVHTTIF
jgi:hypothetical protein